jgi:hypothetical protein
MLFHGGRSSLKLNKKKKLELSTQVCDTKWMEHLFTGERVALDALPCFALHRHEGLSSPIDKALRNRQGRAKRATLLLQKELLLFVICLFLLSFMFINLLYRPLSPSFSLPLVSEEFIHHTAMSVKLTQVKRRIICKLDLLAEIFNVGQKFVYQWKEELHVYWIFLVEIFSAGKNSLKGKTTVRELLKWTIPYVVDVLGKFSP